MESYVQMPSLDGISNDGLESINQVVENFDFNTFVQTIVQGDQAVAPDNILNFLIKTFSKELYSTIKILTVIIAIIIIGAVLENLHSSFGKKSGFNSSFITLVLIMGLSVNIFEDVYLYISSVSNDLTVFMNSLLPVLMSLNAGAGYIAVSVNTNPVIFYMCNIFAVFFDRILLPVSVVYTIVSILNLLSDTIKLNKLRELIKKIYNFILGLIMTVFTGVLSISAYAGISLDSVGAKGARFAISNMVPIVGRSLSETMNAVASASVLLKNAVGITGIIVIVAICIIPVLKVASVILCIRIVSSVCESIASKNSIEILNSVANGLSMMQAAIIMTSVMMIISVGIIVGMCR